MPFLLKTLIMAAMQSGDSLVINFPLATMLTFTSAVAKLTIRVLGQHHSLLQVISQSYCQVFVKSYNFVFEKINIAYAPYQKCQKTRSSVHIHYISTPRVLSKTHQKTAFLHNISISLHKYDNDAVQKALFYGAKQFTNALPSQNSRDFIRL